MKADPRHKVWYVLFVEEPLTKLLYHCTVFSKKVTKKEAHIFVKEQVNIATGTTQLTAPPQLSIIKRSSFSRGPAVAERC